MEKSKLVGNGFLTISKGNSQASGTKHVTANRSSLHMLASTPVFMQAPTKLIKETIFSCVYTRTKSPLD